MNDVFCLLQRFIGLVNGSMSAAYNGSHLTCSYSRLITPPRLPHVMDLSTPRYVLLARGPTGEKGRPVHYVRDHFLLAVIEIDRAC